MFKPKEKVMLFAKVKQVIEDSEGFKYVIEPDYHDTKYRPFNSITVEEGVLRVSDDVVLRQMEEEFKNKK